jgi:hypothetical protein
MKRAMPILFIAAIVAAVSIPLIAIRLFLVEPHPHRFIANGNEEQLGGGDTVMEEDVRRRRRLLLESSSSSAEHHNHDIEHVLSLASQSIEDVFTEGGGDDDNTPSPLRLRVLFIVTTLSEYDKGTRGTTVGADRLKDLVLPILVDGVSSMVQRGWHVDVYLICGYETLAEERQQMIQDALPPGVGLEVWTDAIPFYYAKKFNQQLKQTDQSIELASHGLSRQHRFVVRDKIMEYDFFTAFEDDMRITADHVLNFLEMSAEIDRARRDAEQSSDGLAHVDADDAVQDLRSVRGKSTDKAKVGNDVVQDPMTADDLRKLWPGFVRVEVLDAQSVGDEKDETDSIHQLLVGAQPPLDNYKWMNDVPASMEYETQYGTLDPSICCGVPPGRARTPSNPQKDDLLLWETDISAMGVRHYPGNIGWGAAMTVQDIADVGSYWSGEGHGFGVDMTRPRRVDSLLGQQAGWMATRSQILYFHEHACPGGFLPPFDGKDWFYDSLQTRNG